MQALISVAIFTMAISCLADSGFARTPELSSEEHPVVLAPDPNAVLSSSRTLMGDLAKTSTDTFYLFGGPGTNEGKFQGADGHTPDRQGWVGVDNTDKPLYWQISDFNAGNLGGHGIGNQAAWCGRIPDASEGWANSPGYGNYWDQVMIFESDPIADPATGQTVNLDFVFNYDTETDYDFFDVEYDSAGAWVNVLRVSGSNHDVGNIFAAPGESFAATQNGHGIVYVGNDYGGDTNDRIRIRLRFVSDGAWSDHDGLWITQGGAVQVDDITVTWSDGASYEDFESGWQNSAWRAFKPPFFGDFSKVWPWLEDGDVNECQENTTPVMAFVDAGQVVGNAASAAFIDGYPTSTNGATNPAADYGVPGHWVVNGQGGLSGSPLILISNDVWSPPIDWDLPGPADDGSEILGARLDFSVWADFYSTLIAYRWSIRATTDGVVWSSWVDRGFYYMPNGAPGWQSHSDILTDLLPPNPLRIQLRLGVLAPLRRINAPLNPAPAFDNVSLAKYRVGGPSITAITFELAQDGFPPNGSIDASTQATRDALDIPFDMSLDRAWGVPTIDPGDSIVVHVVTNVPGAVVSDVRMFWVLDKNPFFEDAIRSAPSRPQDHNVVTGPSQWSGEVLGVGPAASSTSPFVDRYFFDLPDVDFLYPGDVLRYYFRAVDDVGRVTTLPENTAGFSSGVAYDRRFVVRGLPSIADAAGTQPSKLVVLHAGHGQEELTILASMGRGLGLVEGVDYDTFVRPSGGDSNGIGSTGGHGAAVEQLGGYDTILFTSGLRTGGVLSDGSATPGNTKSDDLGLLTAWHALPGMRNVAHFGSAVVSALSYESAAGATYVSSVLSAEEKDRSVRDEIQGQTIPLVRAWDVNFTTEFAAAGGCPNPHDFDSILPVGTATVGHVFVDPTGAPVAGPAASVFHDRLVGGDRKVDITFPYALADVYVPRQKAAGSTTSAAELLREVFGYFGVSSGGGLVGAPAAKRFALEVAPNPFNPRTVIRLSGVSEGSRGSVKIYDLRGTLVATLADGELSQQKLVWEGVDDKGHAVSSGVYLIDARSGDQRQTLKVALVR